MERQKQQLERNLDILFRGTGIKEEKIDQIWKKVEMNSLKQTSKPVLGWKLAAIGLGVLLIVIFSIGPSNVWAQMRAWLIPDYRPISQLENYQIVPEKTKENHEGLTLSLLSVRSYRDGLKISILVQGIALVNPETLIDQRDLEPANLILKNGEVIKSLSSGYGIGDGATEYVYELEFPALGNEAGAEVRLVVPDLPYIREPLEEDWVVSMTIDPVEKEDQVPQVAQQTESHGLAQWAEPEIAAVKSNGIKNTEILIRFDMPEGYQALAIGGLQFWSLRDEDGQYYFFNADLSCSIDCPENEIRLITEAALPSGKSYTLTIPRFSMLKNDYGDFYEVDGKTFLPAFLTIDFPENYQAGDFIKIDQWYDIPPFQLHLLGVEILSVSDELVRYRIVTQSPESSHALMDIALCVNQFIEGGSCSEGGYSGEKRPQADELIYSEGSFPRELLIGKVGFYLHQISLTYFPDWELTFDF